MKTLASFVGIVLIAFVISYVSSLSAQSPYNRRTVPVSAERLASGITGITGATSNAVLTPAADCAILGFENTTTSTVFARIGTVNKRIPPSSSRIYDLAAGNVRLGQGTTIGVWGITGALPSTGAFEVMCFPY